LVFGYKQLIQHTDSLNLTYILLFPRFKQAAASQAARQEAVALVLVAAVEVVGLEVEVVDEEGVVAAEVAVDFEQSRALQTLQLEQVNPVSLFWCRHSVGRVWVGRG